MKRTFFRGAVLLVFALLLMGFRLALEDTPQDLLAAVNEFRAEYGLAPYQVDESLMSTAQAQADYMASINKLTHSRPDGNGPETMGISSENIAIGGSLSRMIRQQWADYWHTFTLIGFSAGRAGAGAAQGSDGTLYYVLDVVNTGERLDINALLQGNKTEEPGVLRTASTAALILPVAGTSTPNPDGSVIHVVRSGETLFGIASLYQADAAGLARLNNLDLEKGMIVIGQKILIRPAVSPSPSPSLPAPTATPRPTRTAVKTARPVLPTSQPTPIPEQSFLEKHEVRWIGLGLLAGLALLGGIMIFLSARSRH